MVPVVVVGHEDAGVLITGHTLEDISVTSENLAFNVNGQECYVKKEDWEKYQAWKKSINL